jgi:16S rRNA (adenine1518-N6/adenine1519-N6)-dimethyltransferase
MAAARHPPLRKALAQHHLLRGDLCRPLLEYLRPAASRVLEIGPGGGVLTGELLAAGASVLAWDLDLAWVFALRARLRQPTQRGALRCVAGDALELPWERLPAATLVTGNLPYNVATALIARILDHPQRIPRAAFLVQWEVGERLAAAPGDSAYGALSVLCAARAEVTLLGRVRRGAFRPPPKVDGAFVGFRLQPAPLSPAQWPGFVKTVQLAFNQRRKTLRNALAAGWGREEAERVLAVAGFSATARAQELGVAEFVALHGARALVGGDGR